MPVQTVILKFVLSCLVTLSKFNKRTTLNYIRKILKLLKCLDVAVLGSKHCHPSSIALNNTAAILLLVKVCHFLRSDSGLLIFDLTGLGCHTLT